MQMTRASLDQAVARGLIEPHQRDPLWAFLVEHQQVRGAATPSFKPAHILYYLGGLLAIGAMTLFMTLGWEIFGGGGLVAVSACYAAGSLWLTNFLLRRKHLAIPAGITATLAIVMVPLAVYGAQHLFGWWPEREGGSDAYRDFHTRIDWRWLMMEFATLAAGCVAVWRYRLPFLVMPIAVTLWYMSMDLVPFLLGGDAGDFFSGWARLVSTCFGALMIAVAFWVDLRSRATLDFAFWLYFFGVLTFWGGLTSLDANREIERFAYCAVNLLMIAVGAALARRVFAVFGAIGVAIYLGYLSYQVFKDSLMFPFALTALGLAVIGIGIWWQRHEAGIGNWLRSWLPDPMRELIEVRALG